MNVSNPRQRGIVLAQQCVLAGILLGLGIYAGIALVRSPESGSMTGGRTWIAAGAAALALLTGLGVVPYVALRVRRWMLGLADPTEVPLPGGAHGKWRGRLALVYPATWTATMILLAAAAALNIGVYAQEASALSIGIAALMTIVIIGHFPTVERMDRWVDRQLRRHDEEKMTKFQ